MFTICSQICYKKFIGSSQKQNSARVGRARAAQKKVPPPRQNGEGKEKERIGFEVGGNLVVSVEGFEPSYRREVGRVLPLELYTH